MTVSHRREQLRRFVNAECLKTGASFRLSTGQQSEFYFDCKRATLNGESLDLIAEAFLEEASRLAPPPRAIGGLTMGADFIVAAVIQKAHARGHAMTEGSIVRKEPKPHGTGDRIENRLAPGTRILVIDDVITSGASTEAACDEFKRAGYEIAGVIALIDREAGGCRRLREKYGCVVTAIFRKQDFPSISQGVTDAGRNQGSDAVDDWGKTPIASNA